MGLLSRVRRRERTGAAVAESEAEAPQNLGALRDEIAALSDENRRQPERERERRLLSLRQEAGIAEMQRADPSPEFAAPDATLLRIEERIPVLAPAQLTPGSLRAGILSAGCVLVRGLVRPDEATGFAEEIERAWAARERLRQGGSDSDGYYEEFEPKVGTGVLGRPWLEQGGNLLAADSPRLFFQMLELFERANLPALVAGYLGETPLISLHKSTLRKADPAVSGAWHQDGKFLGPVRALNLWLALSPCGEDAPGLDILPRRLESYLPTGTDDAPLEWTIAQRQVELAAGADPILHPVFEAGDALFFDELFVHQTATDSAMTRPRYAIENWFFGASRFPGDYAPLVV